MALQTNTCLTTASATDLTAAYLNELVWKRHGAWRCKKYFDNSKCPM